MRISYLSYAVIILLFLVVSCKKSGNKEPEEIKDVPFLLTKMTEWNTKTGEEHLKFEFIYNSKHILTNVKSLSENYSLEYDHAGKLTKVVEIHPSSGITTTYTLIYNSAGQVTKVNWVWSANSGQWATVYEYNAAGKIIRSTSSATYGVYEYSWIDDNIHELVTMYGETPFRKIETGYVTKFSYQTALNPYKMNAPFLDYIIYHSPSSKNIPKTMENSSMYNRSLFTADTPPVFTFDIQGNVTSMKFDGFVSNSWRRIWGDASAVELQTKFYYNK